MNPRIYKKQAKRAVELLRSYGERADFLPSDSDESIDYEVWGWRGLDRLRRNDPALARKWERLRGVPVRWYRCSYEYDEWEFETSMKCWLEWYYWGVVVPDDFNGATDDLPAMTLERRRVRLTTRAIAPGWRWRGGRAVRK